MGGIDRRVERSASERSEYRILQNVGGGGPTLRGFEVPSGLNGRRRRASQISDNYSPREVPEGF